MAKKVFWSICGGFAAIGLAVMILGFALGGRAGTFGVQDGRFVYATSQSTYDIASAPSWWREGSGFSFLGGNRLWRGGEMPTATEQGEVALDFQASEVNCVSLDIEAGYVSVQFGDEFSLRVDGPLPYSSRLVNGTWRIEAYQSHANYSTRSVNGRTHFFNGATDMTTDFVITLPYGLQDVTLELGVGTLWVEGVQAGVLEINSAVASVDVRDVQVQQLTLTAEVGDIVATDVTAARCRLSAEVGGITLSGEVSERMEIDCSVGAVNVTMPRPSEYGYIVSSELSNVEIDGSRVSAWLDGDAEHNTGAPLLFVIHSELGDVTIDFE